MDRYAASVGCRHRHLVGYFGETLAKADCGACDFCLGELEPIAEPVVVARKILSAVARVGQRFGTAHVVNVLRGAKTELTASRGHDQLSVFGLLAAMSVDEVRGCIEQMIARDLLEQAGDEFPVLRLTADGLALMKDPARLPDLVLARQRKPEKGKTLRKSKVEGESWEGVDRDLFERLRAAAPARRARSRRAALRHLPRHDAARARAPQAGDDGRATTCVWRRRAQGRGLRADAARGDRSDDALI